ncbi:MAG: EamA family transporter [Actinobacteria bacterium]|nr:EamA family transporter [Actinomycetota bacterium]
MSTGAVSNQTGAAIGANAFAQIGPAGVVAVRQFIAAAVLLAVVRPRLRELTTEQWRPIAGLALVFATMNITLYGAIDRIGIGLAVTLEFLGPLAVALAASRSRRDLALAVVSGAGVYVLVLPGPSSDWTGVGLGVAAGACWAAYILLNRRVGAVVPGLTGTAAATALSATLYVPVAIVVVAHRGLPAEALGLAVLTGLLSSVVPYVADLLSLRVVPAHAFGVFMSINPVIAALAGVALLGQVPESHEVVGIAVIVGVNAVAVASRGRGAPRTV